MKKILMTMLSVLLLLTGCTQTESTTKEVETNDAVIADVVYTNGVLVTEDETTANATAFAVKDGKFVYVGTNEESNAFVGETTEVVDLEGKFVTPSFLDAHSHPGIVGTTAWYTDFPMDVYEKEDILKYVKDYCETHSVEEYPYIYFEYYPSNLFDEKGPRKEWIDEYVSDRPILIEDFSDHACWVNTRFLEDIGAYDGLIPEEEFNFIKDENGDYTGWIKEGAWQGYIGNLYEKNNYFPPEEVTDETLLYTLNDFTKWGITGVMDAYIISEEHVACASELVASGKWNGYFELSYVMDGPEYLEDCIEAVHYLDETYGNDKCHIDTIKIFYDGTNELGNAALIDGWITDETQTGYIMMDTEETKHVIERCNEEGIDVHFHMVGDLAFRQVMDATDALLEELGSLDIQVEVCHCEYVNPEDYDRPAKNGVIVNWTPHWSGGYFGDGSKQYLGEERYNNMYQFNPIIDAGGIVTYGSDIYSAYEEERANPYFSMQTAMTRIDIWDGIYDGARESDEAKLSLENLLEGYTINAAIQMRIDDKVGSITVGKDANFNVFKENLFDVDPMEFKDVLPMAVYYEGNCISGTLTPVKVGISWAMDELDAAEDEDIQAYVEAITVSGGEPVYMLQVTDEQSAKEALAQVDCVVMAGGEDVNPALYGEDMMEWCEEPYDDRDTSDYYLLKTAIEEDVPVLATCRGMQMLNVVCGGTLYQDLYNEYDTDITHRDPELYDFTYHNITVDPDNLLADAMGGSGEYTVNSWHHQGIKTLGEGLKVVALADDGMIEGVVYEDASYVLGVQFHPEWHIVEDTLDCVSVFEALMNATK